MAQSALHPLRRLAGHFGFDQSRRFIGDHGCLNAAASFVSWNQVPGDYLEFGVYRGDSLAAAYHALRCHAREYTSFIGERSGDAAPAYPAWSEKGPRFFAFDSFEGLPAGAGERHPDYAPGAYGCSEAEFRRRIARKGVDLGRVVAVSGFYDVTLTDQTKKEHALTKAAIVMIDCDLYESTVPVLHFITDLIGQGTILIFHDWFRFQGSPKCGEQRACREWLARNPHLELIEHWREGPQAVSFLVNLR